MKLIADIINELVDSDKSLSTPLLKTKVLASRLKNSELLLWVNNELNGYADEQLLPDYRKCDGSIEGTYFNGRLQCINKPIPLSNLTKKQLAALHAMNFNEGVVALEGLAKGGASAKIIKSLSAETVYKLGANVRAIGNPYFNLISARKMTPCTTVTQILSLIQTKLLEFMLKMEDEFGYVSDIEELKLENKRIIALMNQTIINNGDGNILNTGDNSSIRANIKINKGDKEALKQNLQKHQISNADIDELLDVIDLGIPHDSTSLSTDVKGWIHNMLGKAMDGTWQIGIGAAGSILSDAILSYYGLK